MSTLYTNETIAAAVDRFISDKWGDKHGTYKLAARAWDMGAAPLSLTVHGKRPPTQRILNAMGLKKITAYVPKEPQ